MPTRMMMCLQAAGEEPIDEYGEDTHICSPTVARLTAMSGLGFEYLCLSQGVGMGAEC
jgi:hypothetical protein